MINKNKAYKTIILHGLVSRNIGISKNTAQMFVRDKVTDNGSKSLLPLVV
jgi:hypothetical protein